VSAASPEKLTGRCNCGAVSFAATGPFRPAIACHCRSCRRQSGHYLAATEVRQAGLDVSGEAGITWYAATPKAQRGFCATRGGHLFWRENGADTVAIYAGCLDEPTGLALAGHIYVAEKGDYYDITDGLPQWPEG
jgi:hypothetical protein